jgi:hypothetical protein
MNCPDCTAATKNPHWGGYHAACQGCQVRALATGPGFWESSRAGAMTPVYRKALETSFGDGWKNGHTLVKAEHERLKKLSDP